MSASGFPAGQNQYTDREPDTFGDLAIQIQKLCFGEAIQIDNRFLWQPPLPDMSTNSEG